MLEAVLIYVFDDRLNAFTFIIISEICELISTILFISFFLSSCLLLDLRDPFLPLTSTCLGSSGYISILLVVTFKFLMCIIHFSSRV